MISRPNAKGSLTHTAKQKVTATLVPIGDKVISAAEGAEPQPVFLLANLVHVDYTPQEMREAVEKGVEEPTE
jgi:hypothetical protein